MLKKLVILFCLILFVCTGCGKKEETVNDLETILGRGSLIVGVKTDTYPFGYTNAKGDYLGYDVELAKLIAKGLLGDENKVKFVPVSAYDRIMKLESNDVDMIIATMSVTPQRQEILDFSTSYYTAGQALLVKKGSKIRSIKDLKDKRVIIVFGSTSERSIREAVVNVGIIGYKTYTEAYKALKQGKGEAIVADDTILYGLAYKDKDVVLLPKRYSKEPYAVAFRKGKESKQLIKAVNEIIETEARNGTLKKIQKDLGIKG
ncbi:transporter substrate-binding domain-containing protein [bacterium]|nr:transporter substrate-binding domain-containing protein [bacterium]